MAFLLILRICIYLFDLKIKKCTILLFGALFFQKILTNAKLPWFNVHVMYVQTYAEQQKKISTDNQRR